MIHDVIVLGGGASGLCAAIAARRLGAEVLILECSSRLGKKILSTGNGKCNALPVVCNIEKYNSPKVGEIFNIQTPEEIKKFFLSIGVLFRSEGDRLFPCSFQATSVQNALRAEVEKLGINVAIDTKIQEISYKQNFVLYDANVKYMAKSVVIATGSPAGFGLDSSKLLKSFGHTAEPFSPSLCPLITEKPPIKGLRGVRTYAKIALYCGGKKIAECFDEVLFKDNGISGTGIFNVSVALARNGNISNHDAYLLLDFLPEYSEADLKGICIDFINRGCCLESLAHKELIHNICELYLHAELPIGKSKKEIEAFAIGFAKYLKTYKVKIISAGSFELAQVASGGLELSEFDMRTLESLKQKGLYAAGEVLNVDGECGGYNLYWAWASGITAGESAARGLKP